MGGYGVIIRPLVNFAVGMFIFLSGYLTKENENGVYVVKSFAKLIEDGVYQKNLFEDLK